MREEKQLLLDEIGEKMEGSKGFIVMRYQGLTAVKCREFRDLVSEAEGDFEVVRKRVFAKAAETQGLKLDPKTYQGHIGILFAKDPLRLSKAVFKYSEENEKTIEVLGGHIDGALCSAEDIEALAKLPGLDELRAQFLGILEAPMAETLAVLQAILTSILYCMDEKAKKEQS